MPEELQLRLIHLLIGQQLGDNSRSLQATILKQYAPGASNISVRECLLKAFTSGRTPELLLTILREAIRDFADRVRMSHTICHPMTHPARKPVAACARLACH